MPLREQGIQNFYDAVRNTDLARDFQFRIIQLGPNTYNSQLKDRLVYMTTATLPNREITNHQVPFMGLDFNVPGSVKYTGSAAWQVTFRCPQDYSIRKTLEGWTQDIFDDQTSTGDYNIPARDSVIHIALLNNKGNSVREYTLYGAYCQNLGEIQYDLTQTGAPVTFTATLAYQFWRLTKGTFRGETR